MYSHLAHMLMKMIPKEKMRHATFFCTMKSKKAGKIHIEIIFVTLDNYVDIFNPLATATSDFYFIF